MLYRLHFLRGWMAMTVVFGHCFGMFYPELLGVEPMTATNSGSALAHIVRSPLGVFINGAFAVNVFFVLSGFVLALSVIGKKQGPARAVLKRYLRLNIPVACSLFLIGCFLAWNLVFVDDFLAAIGKKEGHAYVPALDWLEIARQASFSSILLGDASYNAVLWTITIEFYGSLLVFSLIALFENVDRRPLIYLAVVLIFIFLRQFYFAEFVVGLLLAEFWTSELKRPSLGTISSLCLLFGSLTLGGLHPFWTIHLPGFGDFYPVGANYWKFFGATGLVFAFAFGKPLIWLAERKCLVKLGEYSFGIYLLHNLILFSLGFWVWKLISVNWGFSFEIAAFGTASAVVVASYICGGLFHHWVEKPSIYFASCFARFVLQSKTTEKL